MSYSLQNENELLKEELKFFAYELKYPRAQKLLKDIFDNARLRTCSRCGSNKLDRDKNWKFRAKHQLTGTCSICDSKQQRESYHKLKGKK